MRARTTLKAAALGLVLLALPAATEPVGVQAHCTVDGQLVGITVRVTRLGVLTLTFPPDLCERTLTTGRPETV